MSQLNLNQITDVDTADSSWKSLYKIAGATVMIAVLLMLLDIVTTIISKESIEYGTFTAINWFTIFHNNWFSGLRNLGLLNVMEMTLTVPMYFALYAAHRHINKTYAALAMILSLAGMAIYISNNAAVPMLVLSSKYAAAATDAQRSLLAAAGEAILARGQDFTPGAFMGFFLGEIATLTISFVMLRGRIFSKVTAYTGIFGVALLTVYTIWVTFIPALQGAAMIFAMIGGPLSMVWSILIARRLFQLGRQ
jgi:hypothetical protein